MKRSLMILMLVSFAALPARADTVALAPPFTGSFTAEGCSMDGKTTPYVGTCTVTHEPTLAGRLTAGVTMSGLADGAVASVGRGESLAKLTITDPIAPGAIPSYDAKFTVVEAAGSRTGALAGAVGDRLVMALLRVVDARPRCAGTIHGSAPGLLVSSDGELAPATSFTLHVDTPPECIRTLGANLVIEVSLFVRVAISDRGVFPGGMAGYEVPGFGAVSALGSVDVELTRTT